MTTAGPRLACANSVITMAMTPRISSTTPALLMIAISRIPMMLIAVVTASRMTPSSTAFLAPLTEVGEESPPRSWKPDQMVGSTAWRARAAAATVSTCPMILSAPGEQRPAGEPAERLPGQPRRPLEERARDREPGREGGEVQRDEHLAGE